MKKLLFISILLTNIGLIAEFSWWTKVKNKIVEKINDYKDWRGAQDYYNGKGLYDTKAATHRDMIDNNPYSSEGILYNKLRRYKRSTNYFSTLSDTDKKAAQNDYKQKLKDAKKQILLTSQGHDKKMYYQEMVRRSHGGIMPENVDQVSMFDK